MKCSECQTENQETRKFCRECGAKLTLLCPQCSSKNLPGDKFCGECGHNLTLPSEPPIKALSLDEKIAKIQRYLPNGLTEKILSQKDKIEGERRHVTVMFCDMKGFTPLTEKLGPEETFSLADQVYEILIHKIHDYGGTVNELRGDGALALFGAPIALEDAPQRAIRSALAIHREMIKFNEKIKIGMEIPEILLRIGINTGPVVVGTVGNDLRVHFTAMGDTINLASRMESLAEPGTIYVTEDTFKLTEGFFRFEALGEKKVKGKEEPVKVYRVIAPSTRRTRFDVSAELGLTPFVGRERELELLLDGFERAKGGRGQVFSIVSEAGLGKSRLLYEFRKAVANENVIFLEGKCLSYGRNVAYHPVVDTLKAAFGIQDNDADHKIKEKVARGLKYLKIEEAFALFFLLDLLSVKNSGIDKTPMSPEARKHRTLEALKEVILRGAEFRPTIVSIEDLHWMDRSSEDALNEILESISAARVFLIFTYRPEFVYTLRSRSYHSQVTLNRLSNRESLTMIRHILGTSYIDQNLQELILKKTEGIPFFIEEFIKSLKDLRAIERKGQKYQLSEEIEKPAIPSIIKDVIMARVDTLPEGAREVLRTGSAIEREFDHDLIKRLTHLPEKKLISHLSSLKDSELLYERGIYPKSTYIFKHALTREVLYDSILARKRKELHKRIANSMEEIYKDKIADHYGVVAAHLIAGENYEKGAEYTRLQAKKYKKAALFKDAIEHQKRSIDCLEHLLQTEANQKKIIDARTTLSNYLLSLGQNSEAKYAVEPIMDLALKLNYRKKLPGIYTAMGLHALWVEEDLSSGIPYINDALKISEEIGDFLSGWFANWYLGVSLTFQCEFDKALSYFDKCSELARLSDNTLGVSSARAMITMAHYLRGNISLSCKVGEETSHLAEESGDLWCKGIAHTQYGCALYHKGEFDKAEKYLLEGLSCSRKTNVSASEFWAGWIIGHLYFDREAYGKAQDFYLQASKVFEKPNLLPSLSNAAKTDTARARMRAEGLKANLNRLFQYFETNKFKFLKGIMSRTIGDILLLLGKEQMGDAEVWIRKAIEADTRNGTQWYLAIDHYLYAKWFKTRGDLSGSKEELAKTIDILGECGAYGWVKKYEKEMSSLS